MNTFLIVIMQKRRRNGPFHDQICMIDHGD